MRTQEQLTLVAMLEDLIAFQYSTSPSHGELPTVELGRNQSLTDAVAQLATSIGITSHGAFRYAGKRESTHVFYVVAEDYDEVENIVWTTKERVMLTESLRKFLSSLQARQNAVA